MKKLLIAATVASAFAAPCAFAQTENFKGLDIGLGVNVARTTVEADLANGQSSSDSATDYNAALQLQYNLALNNAWLLGFGATVALSDLKAGTLFNSTDVKVKNAYSVFVAPAYAFNETWMGYVKVAYLNATASGSGGDTNFDSGYGIGFGARAMLDKNWYGQFEYMNNKYDDKSTFNETDKLKADVLTLSVGYRF